MRRGRERLWTVAFLGLAALGWPVPRPVLAGSRRTPVVEAVQKVQPSVVSISSEKKAASTSRWPFSAEESQRPRVSGMGTGVILDGRGYILTNHHVVDKVQGIEVHLADGTVFPARLLQFDEAMDLAMLKVDAGRPLPAITIGTSADLMVGEDVITIGNAFGYENTVSIGIISALNRNVTLSDEQVYRNLIQTDACINPGNSGGPLINVDGELIGINVAVRAGAQGIGFALPIDDVKRGRGRDDEHAAAGRDLARPGRRRVPHRPGPRGRPVRGPAGQPRRDGRVPARRPGGPRRRPDGHHAPGHRARAARRRPRPDDPGARPAWRPGAGAAARAPVRCPAPSPDAADQVWRMLGLKTTPVSPEYVAAASPKLRGGLYVQAVSPNSPGAHASIQKGDILVGMNVGIRHWETIQPDNILFILRQPEVAQSQTMQFYIVRRNNIHQGTMSLAELPASKVLSR